MAGKILVDTEVMKNTATLIRNKTDELDRITDKANNVVNNMSTWKGDARNAYVSGFAEAKAKMSKAKPVLYEYARVLEEAATKYEEAEQERQTDNATISEGE